MSLAFLIPLKLESVSQTFFIKRCIRSIRRLYPQAPIIVCLAPGTVYENHEVKIVPNVGFSIFGCIRLWHEHKYAEYACILHDSTVLVKRLPEPEAVRFLYHFDEPNLDRPQNDEGYQRLLSREEYCDMIRTHSFGCFGNMIYGDIENTRCLLAYCDKVKTKYDFECMERIVAYILSRNATLLPSVCGSIFDSIANPWVHPEYATRENFDDFPHAVAKTIVNRR